MKRTVAVLFGMIALAATIMAQGSTRGPLEGVWKIAEEVVTGSNASTTTSPQPSLFIFTRTHYSMLRVASAKPRILFKGTDPTTDEKIAAYDTFTANTGTYEISGTTLTVRPIVAKSPNFMAGGFDKYQFRIEGNTLWLTSLSTDINTRVGDRLVPGAGPASETRRKLIRVE
jgi:hypothetical protein